MVGVFRSSDFGVGAAQIFLSSFLRYFRCKRGAVWWYGSGLAGLIKGLAKIYEGLCRNRLWPVGHKFCGLRDFEKSAMLFGLYLSFTQFYVVELLTLLHLEMTILPTGAGTRPDG